MSEKNMKIKLVATAIVDYDPDDLRCEGCAEEQHGNLCGQCAQEVFGETKHFYDFKVEGEVLEVE